MCNLTDNNLTVDLLQPFLIDRSNIRGKLVRLGPVIDKVLTNHNYPLPVSQLLAETLVITAILSSNLKNEGVLTLQISGSGDLLFLVADATHEGALRGYAEMKEGGAVATDKLNFKELVGEGRLAITFDPGKGNRYQGIVELCGDSLADTMESYFAQSQQTEMKVKLGVKPPVNGHGWRAGGMLLERMPEKKLEDEDEELRMWEHNCILMDTLTDDELLDDELSSWTLLERLFHEEGVWAYPLKGLNGECRCSREKILTALQTLPIDDLRSLLEGEAIEVHCQFCNQSERFTQKELSQREMI